jgi:hypothetical protein
MKPLAINARRCLEKEEETGLLAGLLFAIL